MRYRSRIVLQSQTSETFAGGCYTVTWNTVNTYWAEVSEEGGNEYVNEKDQQRTTIKIIVRSNIEIDKSIHRFLFNGRIVHIKNVNDKSNLGINNVIIGEVEENVT